MPSETFKPSKVSLKFKAPFNPTWFGVASPRALHARAIRRQFRGMWPGAASISLVREIQGVLSQGIPSSFVQGSLFLLTLIASAISCNQCSTQTGYQNFMCVLEVLQKLGEQQQSFSLDNRGCVRLGYDWFYKEPYLLALRPSWVSEIEITLWN